MKVSLIISLFIMAMTLSFAADAQSIAWFNPTKVLKNSRPGKRVLAKQQALQKKFASKRKQAESPLAKEKNSIEKEWKNFQANQNVLNAKERKRRLSKIKAKYDAWMEKVKKLQYKLAKLQQDMAKEFQKVAEPFSRKLKSAAAKIASQNGYSFIIAHDPKNPQVLLYAKPSLNVTSKLISILGN